MAKTPKQAPLPGPAWKAAQRRALAGVRHPHPLDPPPPPITREEGWAKLLEVERAEDAVCGPLRFADAAAEALYAPIRASYASAVAPMPLDPAAERLRARLLHTHHTTDDPDPAYQALAAWWVGSAGLGFVLDVCRADEAWTYSTTGLARTLLRAADGASGRGLAWGGLQHHLPIELRRLVFALPEVDFARARDEGVAWLDRRPDPPSHERNAETALVAFVLARDAAFADGVVRRAIEHGEAAEHGALLASTADLALARAFVHRYAGLLPLHGATRALDVVEAFGRDAAGLMDAILAPTIGAKPALKPFYKGRLEAARALALTDPRPPTP